ncbi:hypothetical protein EVAR_78418_1 [Eumeta japonica]|uniref:Uncharacterized protein n=1 Tax=Eumeta variegata TaxID=151549 RepID=A0A4C1TY72_EUMVA|nr:hypothetical protein EVAR_78418_1 [Eumeta japonica]
MDHAVNHDSDVVPSFDFSPRSDYDPDPSPDLNPGFVKNIHVTPAAPHAWTYNEFFHFLYRWTTLSCYVVELTEVSHLTISLTFKAELLPGEKEINRDTNAAKRFDGALKHFLLGFNENSCTSGTKNPTFLPPRQRVVVAHWLKWLHTNREVSSSILTTEVFELSQIKLVTPCLEDHVKPPAPHRPSALTAVVIVPVTAAIGSPHPALGGHEELRILAPQQNEPPGECPLTGPINGSAPAIWGKRVCIHARAPFNQIVSGSRTLNLDV